VATQSGAVTEWPCQFCGKLATGVLVKAITLMTNDLYPVPCRIPAVAGVLNEEFELPLLRSVAWEATAHFPESNTVPLGWKTARGWCDHGPLFDFEITSYRFSASNSFLVISR